jgi:hypothetical protein
VFLVPAVHVELSDAFNTELLLLKLDFVGVWCEFRGKHSDLIREGGREKNDLDGTVARKHAL